MSNLTKRDYAILNSLVGTMIIESKKLQPKEELELEIKIPNMNQADFNTLYEAVVALKHVGKVQQSIFAIEDVSKPAKTRTWESRKVKRMEMYFNKGVRDKGMDQYIEKTNITRFQKGKPTEYVVKLAKEKVINPSDFNAAAITGYRFRVRSSIMVNDKDYPEFNNWRFDFTYTRMLNKRDNASIIQKLPEFRDRFFRVGSSSGGPDAKSFLDWEPPSDATGASIEYEVELEWVPGDNGESAKKDPTRFVSEIEQLMPTVLGLVDPTYYERLGYHQLMTEVAEALLPRNEALDYKSRKTLKNIVNRPKSFTKKDWKTEILPRIDDFYISDKADGERAFLIIDSEFVADAPGSTLLLTADRAIRLVDINSPKDYHGAGLTVCDVEIMDLSGNGDKTKYGDIYLFDVLMYKGKKITSEGLEKRETYLDLLARALGPKVHKKVLKRLSADSYGKQIKEVYERKERAYKIDGLIFTEAGESYNKMTTYKWKPVDELTIDFLIMAIPKHMVGMKPYTPPAGHTAFWLFSGTRNSELERSSMQKIKGWSDIFNSSEYPNMFRGGPNRMVPIQFSTPSHPYAYIYYHPNTGPASKIANAEELHGHVGEFLWSASESVESVESFTLKNMRPDKDIEVKNGTSYGNAYQVALNTFMVIMNPVTIEDLTANSGGSERSGSSGSSGSHGNTIERQYFQAQKADMYKPAVKFNNFVVAQLLRMCEDSSWIVDLAGGRGSHLFTYNGFGVHNGVFVDNDRDAVEELVKRSESFGNRSLYLYGNRPSKNMKVYTAVTDLNKSAEATLKKLEDIPMPEGVDAVVCTFALHYLVGKSGTGPGTISNVMELVDSLLRPGGVFIFTCFDGPRVRTLLESSDDATSNAWQRHEGGQLKYSIKKVPGSVDRISVIHPFSNGEHYTENLVDVDAVIDLFHKKHGYKVQQNGSFGDWLIKFQQFNTRMYDDMSDDDKLYTSLYQYVSLWKPVQK